MAAVVIVGVHPAGGRGAAFGLGSVRAGVGPFLEQGAVEPLDLAVGLRPVGPGPFVGDVVAGESVPTRRLLTAEKGAAA